MLVRFKITTRGWIKLPVDRPADARYEALRARLQALLDELARDLQ